MAEEIAPPQNQTPRIEIHPQTDATLETTQFSQLNATRSRSRSIHRQMPTELQILRKREVIRLMELKDQLMVVRERKKTIPKVPDPEVVNIFAMLKQTKKKMMIRQKLKEKIEQKKKELSKLKHLYIKSELEFQEKSEVFKQKSALLRVLGGKMETELTKTKQRYREVEFNRVIIQGVRKVLLFRLSEIMLNERARAIFGILTNTSELKDQDTVGNCLGYLVLFVCLVGTICGARIWINFTFRGPKSTIKSSDGSLLILHPKESRIAQAMKLLNEQLFQMMRDSLQLKVTSNQNFYQLCEELSKQILTIR